MINKATKKQLERINSLKQEWIDNTTKQYSFSEVKEVVDRMYCGMGLKKPIVLLAPSPLSMVIWSSVVSKILPKVIHCKNQLRSQLSSQLSFQLSTQLSSQLDSQLDSQLRSQLYSQLDSQLGSQLSFQLGSQLTKEPFYIGCWWRTWSGWYAGAKILGVVFNEEKLSLFTDFNERASVWCAYNNLCVVSANPKIIKWQDGELHNENGMSVEYEDWGLYSINGVRVDEQIVLHPQEQTIEQINAEDNEEVKRIRIERYGWESYLDKSNAKVLESRINDIDNTRESLMICNEMKILVGACCSTGRVYSLEVPSEVQSCEQAQNWLRNSEKGFCIGAS